MSFWTSCKSLLRGFGRSSLASLNQARRQHILQRHRRSFLESLENRQLMAGIGQPPTFTTSQTAHVIEGGPAELLAPDLVMTDPDSTNYPGQASLYFYVGEQHLTLNVLDSGMGPGQIG